MLWALLILGVVNAALTGWLIYSLAGRFLVLNSEIIKKLEQFSTALREQTPLLQGLHEEARGEIEIIDDAGFVRCRRHPGHQDLREALQTSGLRLRFPDGRIEIGKP
jgi:hypothetical protein